MKKKLSNLWESLRFKSSADSKQEVDKPKKNRWKVFRIQLTIFLILFIVAEMVLRMVGYKPGVLDNFYYQEGDAVYDPVLYADEMGITHHKSNARFFSGQVMNKEGYFNEVEFTKESMDSLRAQGKKIIFLVGDSFTSGCCVDNYKNSFAHLLNQSEDYEVLNFGVGGTDPLHYELVIKKYLPLLEPDLILVPVYLGNDEMVYDRTPKPFIPVCYPVKNGHWLSSEAYINLRPADTHFKNFKEAKKFFYTYYSLRSDESNWFESTIKHSVILSRLYLHSKIYFEQRRMRDKLFSPPKKPPYTYNHLKEIQTFCEDHSTKVIFTAIESPPDIIENISATKKYHHLFNELTWTIPKNIVIEDYDGKETGSHYNESGHKKYAKFLRNKIAKEL